VTLSPQEVLTGDFAEFAHNPLSLCQYAFPWNEAGELESAGGPRLWQCDILDSIGRHLQNEATRFQPGRVSVASGKGIGKSALIAMIINWAMSTCID